MHPIFKSKRFWSAVVGLVFMVLTQLVPDLKANQETLITGAMILIGLLIGGYSLEDAMTALNKPEQK